MNRQLVAASFAALFLLSGLILRPALLRWRTGRWGLNGLSGPVWSAGWWGGLSFGAALIAVPVALCLEPFPRSGLLAVPGVLLMAAGLGVTLLAQSRMGASWRIGVQPAERTALVTTGLFRCVRNPIFSGMGAFMAGLALLWPNVASLLAFASLVAGVQLQVRFVEEPYLRAVHGEAWLTWAQQVGRFLPKLSVRRARSPSGEP